MCLKHVGESWFLSPSLLSRAPVLSHLSHLVVSEVGRQEEAERRVGSGDEERLIRVQTSVKISYRIQSEILSF